MSENNFEGVRFEMADCEKTLLAEIAGQSTRRDIAQTYALALRSSERDTIDWKKVNRAIIDKWCINALEYIKKLAHSGKCFEGR